MSAQPTTVPDQRAAVTHVGFKIFGYLVLLLMAISILYTIYIVMVNWSHVGV